MENKYSYRQMDTAVDHGIKTFYLVGKDTQEVVLTDIDSKNYKHRAIYAIAEIVRAVFGIESYLKCSLWQYIKIRIAAPQGQKPLKWYSGYGIQRTTQHINVDELAAAIEKDLNMPDILDEVYARYYGAQSWQ